MRSLQQGTAALVCMTYVGYVGYNRFGSHRETALENARERGRKKAEARVTRILLDGERSTSRGNDKCSDNDVHRVQQ